MLEKRYLGVRHTPTKYEVRQKQQHRSTHCCLTGSELEEPIVCDDMGNLFNKAALLKSMIDGTLPEDLAEYNFKYQHLTNLNLKRLNPGEGADGAIFCCPITGLHMNGLVGFVALKPSGHVVSRRAVIKHPASVSRLIGTSNWTKANVVPLNPTEPEADVLWKRVNQIRGQEMLEKKILEAENQKRRQAQLLRKLKRGRKGVDSAGAGGEDDFDEQQQRTPHDDDDDADEMDEMDFRAAPSRKQKAIREEILNEMGNHARRPLREEDLEDNNFLTKDADPMALDHSIHLGEQMDGRGNSKGFYRNVGYQRHVRKADFERREG